MKTINKYSSVKEYIKDMEYRVNNKNIFTKIKDYIEFNIIYPIINIFHPRYNWYRLKRLYQRITRGWDDSDIWSLDYTLGEFMTKRLKRFKKLTNGIPSIILEEVQKDYPKCSEDQIENMALGRWKLILDKLINTFELMSDDSYIYNFEISNISEDEIIDEIHKREKKHYKEISDGLELFKKYFRCLWT